MKSAPINLWLLVSVAIAAMAQVGILVGFFGAVLVIALGKPVLRLWE